MFSQFINVVENLAHTTANSSHNSHSNPQTPEAANANRSTTSPGDAHARRSLNIPAPGYLAESALSGIRHSLSLQRSGSPVQGQRRSLPAESELKTVSPKPALEDRLKANFVIGDTSTSNTPNISGRATPLRSINPASVPLPSSPPLPASLSDPLSLDSITTQSLDIPQPIQREPKPSNEIPVDPSPTTPSGVLIPKAPTKPSVPQSPDILEASIPLPDDENIILDGEQTSSVPVSTHAVDDFTSRPQPPEMPEAVSDARPDIDRLQEKLKELEKRLGEMSISYQALQAQREAANSALQEISPVEGIHDVTGIKDFIAGLQTKTQMSTDEIKRLNGKIAQQESRTEELRDIHRLESASQSDQIERLRKQLLESESLLSAASAETQDRRTELDNLRRDLEKSQNTAKDEEEKRTKAISLLKTVRQKLLKAEKERDEATEEAKVLREKDKNTRQAERSERQRLENEIGKIKADGESDLRDLRLSHERGVELVRERLIKESESRAAVLEREIASLKSIHNEELSKRMSRISSLEQSLQALTSEKDDLFDRLQLRAAELESSQSHLQALQSKTTELQFQLRESSERLAVSLEELTELRETLPSSGTMTSAEEVTRLLLETEGKYEAKLSELRQRIRSLEKERAESEEEWSRNLSEKTKELDRLRRDLGAKAKETNENAERGKTHEARIAELEGTIRQLQQDAKVQELVRTELEFKLAASKDKNADLEQNLEEGLLRIKTIEKHLDEARGRESQLKTSNKTLREELRKVQSSQALFERQRNPGVGYWGASSSRSNGSSPEIAPRHSSESISSQTSNAMVASGNEDEEAVSLEYIRNIILQFLENKEMRPNLVRVLSMILRFTPQETRRLMAKV
ncbi:hypothetical protein SISNIDRAFT_100481 [Sistotremastrum niveocremeum HHB9708]|uniref:GRIP domain-containing protein n=1 Tax=Sistotremastrum niveocremeum HHB9708 TaxID=1314777 RepID=A0A164UBP1_9AGAM|nr:hypothetical protein SISNIDRAFT_100481 [Sistotremastrum niveocremeum HHB9708]